MKNSNLSKFVFLMIVLNSIIFAGIAKKDKLQYVTTLVGSDSEFKLSNGNTYPAIALPWGMNFWTPVTNTDRRSGWAYQYDAYKITGFKQTHQPSPWINDYGAFAIMPITGELKADTDERGSWFSHKAEIAKPHYYSIYLADYDLTTEITPTDRSSQFRITYPEKENSYLIIDGYGGGNYLKIFPDEKKIIGYTSNNSGGVPHNFKNYFIVKYEKEIDEITFWKNGKIISEKSDAKGKHVQLILKFSTESDEHVNLKVASSFISFEQAELNLDREIGTDDFDTTKDKAISVWNKELNKLDVEGGTVDQKRVFYTSLYRTLLFPRKFYEFDKDNNIVHYSPYNGEVLPGYMFTDNGFWDTFRAVFPFFTLMYPELNSNIMDGLANTYKESGWLPEWASPGHRDCMVGSNSASLIADSYLKGIRGFDIETLFEALLKNSNNAGPLTSVGRAGVEYYNTLGYIPYNVGVNENVARTLEYSYDDFTIWRLAKALGKSDEIINLFYEQAHYYQNVFDPTTNFMRGKNKDGNFQSPFVPEKWGDAFTEGCSWHYTWSVFHDVQGLVNLMGGRDNFIEKLDSVFIAPPTFDYSYYGQQIHEITEMLIADMGQYAHGNQPIQHGIYLYNYIGQPWKTQKYVREVMDRLYTDMPDGLCGDEDNGQTSAWYVFSAMGMYPVCPGSDEYVLGAPIFDKITLSLENGKKFEIIGNNNSKENFYVQSAKFNGKKYTKTFLNHFDIMKGGDFEFQMSDKPNKKWGTGKTDAPYSMSKTAFAPPPYLKSGEGVFLEKSEVELASKIKNSEIRYTTDGSEPTKDSIIYEGKIILTESTTLKFRNFVEGMEPSPITSAAFEKAQFLPALKLDKKPTKGLKFQYFEGGVSSVEDMKNPVKEGKVKFLDISGAKVENQFGYIFSGYIEVPTDDLYTIYLTSDDGSKLWIDGKEQIDLDGGHSELTAPKKLALKKGKHEFLLKYFEGWGGETLKLGWESSTIQRTEIPVKYYYH